MPHMNLLPTPLALALALACLLLPAPPAGAQEAPPAQDFETQLAQARDLATSDHKPEAIALYDAMLQRSPGNSDVLLARGRTFAWMDRWPEAEADLVAVTSAKPGYADAWSALGDMYLWSDRPAQAADAYARRVALEPDSADAQVALGRALRDAGSRDAARAAFEAAGARGLPAAEVADLVATLQPRTANPDAAAAAGYRWSLRVGAEHTAFDPDRVAWNDASVTLRRHFARGSLGLELLHADRFDTRDSAWALDAYAPLWTRAYANLRYQHGDADGLFARRAWRVEVFQGVATGWELSASYDRLEFGGPGVDMYGAGIGRYAGNWYLRYRALHVPGVGSGSLSHRGLARWYYAGNADDYVEVSAGTGRSVDAAGAATGETIRRSSASAGIAWVRFPGPRWGFKLGAGIANNVDGYDERAVSGALYLRW
jgi:YaiO family outer membrane protein